MPGLPLYRLLGGWADEVPAYASGGYYRPGDPLQNIRDEVLFHKELGFTDFKIKIGGAAFDVDVDRVRIARETIGPSGRLALDANNAWRWPFEAIQFARASRTAISGGWRNRSRRMTSPAMQRSHERSNAGGDGGDSRDPVGFPRHY